MSKTKKETILEIKEIIDDEMSGYEILTTKQRIKCLIENKTSCCEDFGYFWCNDNINDFVGAEIIGIAIVDDCLNTKIFKDNFNANISENEINSIAVFVNIGTSAGLLQFVAYNEHNGGYAHDAKVSSNQLSHSCLL